jgi:tetratricopeptide (TPR) repeat protein
MFSAPPLPCVASVLAAVLLLGAGALHGQGRTAQPANPGRGATTPPRGPRQAARGPATPARPVLSTTALDALTRDATAAFAAGNFARCVELCRQILTQAPPGSQPRLDRVYFTLAAALMRQGDHAAAIPVLREYLASYPHRGQAGEALLALVQALLATGRTDDAFTEIGNLLENPAGLDDLAAPLALALSAADAQARVGAHDAVVSRLQTLPSGRRLLELQRQHTAALAVQLRDNPDPALRAPLTAKLDAARAALARMEKDGALELPRQLRLAAALLKLDHPWEAALLYGDLLTRFPAAPDRVFALHGLALAREHTGRHEEAMLACRRLLDDFPGHTLAPEAAEQGGRLALRLGRNADALAFYAFAADAAKKSGDAARLDRARLALADTRFAASDWDGARADAESYLRESPAGAERERMAYLVALTWMAAHNYARAEPALRNFLAQFPQSASRADAAYRLAYCRHARQEHSAALAACDEWLKEHADAPLVRAAVLALKGDILAALKRPADALNAYRIAAESPGTSDEVLQHALAESARLLAEQRDWDGTVELFQAAMARAPRSPLAPGWAAQAAQAHLRANRPDAAWELVAGRVGGILRDAANDSAEEMLALMAQIQIRRQSAGSRPTPPPAGEQQEAKTAAPPATATSLAERLLPDPAQRTPLALARLALFEARLLQADGKNAEADALLATATRDTPPERLSAPLLAEAGEALLRQGAATRAAVFFESLLARFPKSDWRDLAHTGLGDLALARGDGAAALAAYTAALGSDGAPHRLREATVGQARALFQLGRLGEAEQLFTTIAATREWRGESTALSLYFLGAIAVRQGDPARGLAFFQRVYVSQGRFPEWVARAYLDSGLALEKLNQPAEAAATYREMLADERLRDRPETAAARARLNALPPAT